MTAESRVRQRSRTRERLLLLALILFAFALRTHRLGTQSLWYDEAVTAQVSAQGIAELTRWTADDIQPPLYYYLVAGWQRFAGNSEWSLRYPSVFASLLAVPLLWAVAARLFRRGGGGRAPRLIAAWLAATAPAWVYYAQEARMYALLMALALLAGYALLRALRAGAVAWWGAFVVGAAAMLYTHYFGAFLVATYAACGAVWALWRGDAGSAGVDDGRDNRLTLAPALALAGSAGASAGELPVRNARGDVLAHSIRPEVRTGGFSRLPWIRREVRQNAQTPTTHKPRAASLRSLVLSLVAIAILYLPWLPAMVTRLRVDRSYWQGPFKLGEALRHIAVQFTAGAPEMALEANALRWLPYFGATLLIAILGMLLVRREDRRYRHAASALALGAVLVLPIAAVLILASRTPKFNPRYLLMVSPAYPALLAGGAGSLWHAGARTPRFRAWMLVLSAAIIGFQGITSYVSLRNWFTDPAFTKAQWREVAAAVRREITPGGRVLLVSGHAAPAWTYYAPDIPVVRLPDIDVLDVNAVIGYDAGPRLQSTLAGSTDLWLVRWQEEVVDPNGFVPFLLGRAGSEIPAPGPFWHVGLNHWQLNPGAQFSSGPQPAHLDAANFDHKLALLGWDNPAAGELTVYWRGLNPMMRDYLVSLVLEGAAGEAGRWDGRPAGYDYDTRRWRPGEALFGRYPLPIPQDAPAGNYYITLAVYDQADPQGLDIRDVADNPAGKRVRLGPITITP